MNITIFIYEVKADHVQENIDCILAEFTELKKSPTGLHYALFNLEDGLSSVHITSLEDGIEGDSLP